MNLLSPSRSLCVTKFGDHIFRAIEATIHIQCLRFRYLLGSSELGKESCLMGIGVTCAGNTCAGYFYSLKVWGLSLYLALVSTQF
jgi:hypothetical protein